MRGLCYISDDSHKDDNVLHFTFTTISSKAKCCYASVNLDTVHRNSDHEIFCSQTFSSFR